MLRLLQRQGATTDRVSLPSLMTLTGCIAAPNRRRTPWYRYFQLELSPQRWFRSSASLSLPEPSRPLHHPRRPRRLHPPPFANLSSATKWQRVHKPRREKRPKKKFSLPERVFGART